jgi:hypothetical protein
LLQKGLLKSGDCAVFIFLKALFANGVRRGGLQGHDDQGAYA